MKKMLRKLLQYLFTAIVIISMVAPSPVLAQEGETPVVEATAVSTEAPVVEETASPTDAPVVTEAPTDVPTEVVTDAPTEVVTDEPTEVVTEIPTEIITDQPAGESVDTSGTTEPTEAVTDEPTDEPTEIVTEAPTEVPAEDENLTDMVGILNAGDIVITDENGDAVSLASEAAAEVLSNSDPFYWDGTQWVGYTYTGSTCPSFVTSCTQTNTPFTAALNAVSTTGTTIYVASGYYDEEVTIDTAGLTLIAYDKTASDGGITGTSTSSVISSYTQGIATVKSLILSAAFEKTLGVYANAIEVTETGYLSDALLLANASNPDTTIEADIIIVDDGNNYFSVRDANHTEDVAFEWECGEPERGIDTNTVYRVILRNSSSDEVLNYYTAEGDERSTDMNAAERIADLILGINMSEQMSVASVCTIGTYNAATGKCETDKGCQDGYTLVDGKCVASASATCVTGTTWDSSLKKCVATGSCDTANGYTITNGKCVATDAVNCPTGTTSNGSECVADPICSGGYKYSTVFDNCYKGFSTKSATCPAGSSLDGWNDRCEADLSCDSGYTLSGGSCIKTADVTCTTGTTWDGTRCKADGLCDTANGYVLTNGVCKKTIDKTCLNGTWSNSAGKCIADAACPTGTTSVTYGSYSFCVTDEWATTNSTTLNDEQSVFWNLLGQTHDATPLTGVQQTYANFITSGSYDSTITQTLGAWFLFPEAIRYNGIGSTYYYDYGIDLLNLFPFSVWNTQLTFLKAAIPVTGACATGYETYNGKCVPQCKSSEYRDVFGNCINSQQISVCHKTSSGTNPYVTETVAFNSIYDNSCSVKGGHGDDIIPPNACNASGSGDQAIIAAGCFVSNPSFTINKRVTSTGTYAKDSVISYAIDVVNTGNVELTNVTITDSVPADLASCASGSLAVGATKTCTATHKVTQADVDAGTYTNTAYANATGLSQISDAETVSIAQTKAFTINKSVTSSGPYVLNSTISYNIAVTNTGTVTLSGVAITDSVPADLAACESGSLAVGATKNCTAAHKVTQDDVDAGTYTNTAYANATGLSQISDAETVSIAQTKAFTINKSVTSSAPYVLNSTISYNIAVKNTGTVTLSGVTITDSVPADLAACASGSLAVGQTKNCTATHTVTQDDVDAGTYTNTAYANATGLSQISDAETVSIAQTKAFTIDKTVTSSGPYALKSTITYNIAVANTGTVTLNGVTITDSVPGDLAACAAGSLAVGATKNCTATHEVTQADVDAGTYTNTAYADATGMAQISDYASSIINQTKSLTIDKSVTSSGPYSLGNTISYKIEVVNNGTVTLHNVTIADTGAVLADCPASSLAPKASMSCTATHEVTQADVEAGTYKNTATVDSTETELISDDASSTIDQVKSISLTKTAKEKVSRYDAVGDVLNYDYVITNTGTVAVYAPYSVSDNKTTVDCPSSPASLAPNASVTCTSTYTITQEDLDNGYVTNEATANAVDSSSKTVTSDKVTEKVDAYQIRGLSIVKSINPSSVPYTIGTTISYTILVTNTGNVTENVSITDPGVEDMDCSLSSAAFTPNATITCTASHVVTAADIAAGLTYVNTAFAEVPDYVQPVSSSATASLDIPGCMDSTASNYNASATISDGTCTYPSPVVTTTVAVPVTGLRGMNTLGVGGLIPVTGARIITAGLGHTCMTAGDGQVLCWGLNDAGQVGDGTNINRSTPVFVKNMTEVSDLSAGSKHTCALNADGEVWCWGANTSGQLGNGTNTDSSTPVKVTGLPDEAFIITAGEEFTCAMLKNKEVWCWGENGEGQLNDGTTTNSSSPVKSLVDVMPNDISGGQSSLLGDVTTSVNAWSNEEAAIVKELGSSLSISANRWANGGCAVTVSGEVKCWGKDLLSSEVEDALTAMLVGTGLGHGCALNNDQTVSCWGDNTDGELGNGSNTDSTSATLVKGLSEVNDLAAGAHHTCVLVGTGYAAKCWGQNTYGQLGNNTTADSNVPVWVIEPTD